MRMGLARLAMRLRGILLRPHRLRLSSVASAAHRIGKIRGRRCRLHRCLLSALYGGSRRRRSSHRLSSSPLSCYQHFGGRISSGNCL